MLRIVLKISFLAWVVTLPVRAQEAPLKTIDEVLAAFLDANGGRENVDGIISIRATGTIVTESGTEFDIVVVRKYPKKKRVTTILENAIIHRAFDGETSWKHVIFDKGKQEQVTILEGDEKARFEQDVFLLDALFYEEAPGIHHELVGVEYVGRVPCYVVNSVLGETHRTSYVDSRSFRIPKVIESSVGEDGKEVKIEQRLEDYKKVHGIWIARTVIRGGDSGARAEFKEVRINNGIFNSIFSVPEVD